MGCPFFSEYHSSKIYFYSTKSGTNFDNGQKEMKMYEDRYLFLNVCVCVCM